MDIKTITLTLPIEAFTTLRLLADSQGKSPENKAEEMLVRSLLDNDLKQLRLDFEKLRQDFAVCTQAMLEKGGQLTAEEARLWVSRNLLQY